MNLPSQILHYINGSLTPSADHRWLDVFQPSTGHVYAQLSAGSKQDVDLAVEAASAAGRSWASTSGKIDVPCSTALQMVLKKRFEGFAYAESFDNGKPLSLSRAMDIPRAISNFRFFGNAITQFASESHETTGSSAINYTLRQPIGVVACISPGTCPYIFFHGK